MPSASALSREALAQPPDIPPGQLLLAYSGGRDSSVLLHAIHSLCARGSLPGFQLCAVHVHHGIHPQADRWVAHCARQAMALDVPLEVERLNLTRHGGDLGEEALAREARYAALLRHLAPNGRLLTAHHAEDQLETMLLALARGAGVQGLAAMPLVQRRGEGWHLRPLLHWTGEQLDAYARRHQIEYVDDPSNADPRHARSYLRREVLPLLHTRWPGIAVSAVRSAAHCGVAAALGDVLANADAGASLAALERLPLPRLTALSPDRQRNLLRSWCRARGHRPPPERRLAQGLSDLLGCAADALPSVQWDDVALRRYRDKLYLVSPPSVTLDPPACPSSDPLALPRGLGRLAITLVEPGVGTLRIDRDRWYAAPIRVGFRQGGERVRLSGREGTRRLKHLLQEWGVVPWMRGRIPLLYQGDAIVVIGDLAVTADYAAKPDAAALEVRWEGHPSVR
ncbi:MAG: tRNA lysidine(34) synthetase TilS [Pseudomonadota bacterium]